MNALFNAFYALYFRNKCAEQLSQLLCSFMLTVDDTEDENQFVIFTKSFLSYDSSHRAYIYARIYDFS